MGEITEEVHTDYERRVTVAVRPDVGGRVTLVIDDGGPGVHEIWGAGPVLDALAALRVRSLAMRRPPGPPDTGD